MLRSRRERLLVPIALTLVVSAGMAVRGYRVTERSLWFDEAFSWRITQFPWAEMLARAARDNNPPLYYVVLKAWCAVFGDSVLSLRALSVLLGGATIAGAYFLTSEIVARSDASRYWQRRRGPLFTGLLAAGFVATSVFQIRWSWEVRMYTMGTALAVWSTWLLLRAMRAERSALLQWLAYSVVALAFLYTHTYAIFSIAAQVVYVSARLLLKHKRRFRPAHAFAAAGIIGIGFSPWVPILLDQRAQVQADFWSGPLAAWSVPNLCYTLFVHPESTYLTRLQSAAAAALCLAGLVALLWRAGSGEWVVFLSAVLPVVLAVALCIWDTCAFTARYFAFAHVFLLVGLALLVGRIPHGFEAGAVGIALLVNAAIVHVVFWQELDAPGKPGMRGAGAYISERRKPGEPVVVCSPFYYFPALYHSNRRDACRLLDRGKPMPHYQGTAALVPRDLITGPDLRSITAGRVWAIEMRAAGWGHSHVDAPAGWSVISEASFPEAYYVQGTVEVLEYATGSSRTPRKEEQAPQSQAEG